MPGRVSNNFLLNGQNGSLTGAVFLNFELPISLERAFWPPVLLEQREQRLVSFRHSCTGGNEPNLHPSSTLRRRALGS